MDMPTYTFRWITSVAEVSKPTWDALALPLKTPFLEWEWLRLLEESGSALPSTGWLPMHLTVWQEDALVAAAPLYAKRHSEGEFVFDHPWVDVAQRMGLRYYPKLVGMSPFTPTGTYRFLVTRDQDEIALTKAMLGEIESHCLELGFSGCHFHYVDPAWRKLIMPAGYSCWTHQSFTWRNRGYTDLDDFLNRFSRNQRRNVHRERQAMDRDGIRVRMLEGREIPEKLYARMYGYYLETNEKFGPWGCRYLTEEFFRLLPARFGERVAMCVADKPADSPEPLGMGLFIVKDGNLYGRYWGGVEGQRYLHFNVCYYEPMAWAIAKGLSTFDPGIGGYHKVRRGFVCVPNYSLHKFFDPRLRRIMEMHMDEINFMERQQILEINKELPFVRRR
ncbi:protein of unknown function DUF482 [Desulfocurvibacter africanus subsp. africanus str. Walvis Bay]|uniref:BioF2-like acetyltransferase domain-containing protein n=2 Tax=Desulfocurvibacter africanus TaxID=873 RepID=F3Z245_DESAF|nr:protein of unknown function DUF482 [Desulfocurvibacter africanus subsp. africanus str. Walvis Bay]